ncbi:MAG: hypothetical protein M1831_004631 [Alyxoria varia]|nr:MAG: hypothetical protein M1831_004631 [Alyxoria varia]
MAIFDDLPYEMQWQVLEQTVLDEGLESMRLRRVNPEAFSDMIPAIIYRSDPRELKIGASEWDLPYFTDSDEEVEEASEESSPPEDPPKDPSRDFNEKLLFERVKREQNLKSYPFVKSILQQTQNLMRLERLHGDAKGSDAEEFESVDRVVPEISRRRSKDPQVENLRTRIISALCTFWAFDPYVDAKEAPRALASLNARPTVNQVTAAAASGLTTLTKKLLLDEEAKSLLNREPDQFTVFQAAYFATRGGYVELAKLLWQDYKEKTVLDTVNGISNEDEMQNAAQILTAACASKREDLVQFYVDSSLVFRRVFFLCNAPLEKLVHDIRGPQVAVSTTSMRSVQAVLTSQEVANVVDRGLHAIYWYIFEAILDLRRGPSSVE